MRVFNLAIVGFQCALVAFIILVSTDMRAQCNSSSPSALMCQDATISCLSGACYATESESDQGHAGFCGGGTLVHNPQYFLFVARDSVVTIAITINSCTSGAGLQSAIIDIDDDVPGCADWTNGDVIACDPNFNGSTSMTAAPLVIGDTYLVLLDGSNGATCEYVFTQVIGTEEYELLGELEEIVSFKPFACAGDTTWSATVAPAVGEAFGYLWEGMPGGDVVSITTTLDQTTAGFDGIPADALPGAYEVCVTAYSGCDTGEVSLCFSMQVLEVDDEDGPPVIYCPEEYDIGVPWGDSLIFEPGVHSVVFYTSEGCPFDSIKVFNAYPEVIAGVIDTVVCAEEFDYEGITYYISGVYTLFYEGGSVNSCDSMAILNLEMAFIRASPTLSCEFENVIVTANISALTPNDSSLTYRWLDASDSLISAQREWIVNTPGKYRLEVGVNADTTGCIFPNMGEDWSIVVTDEHLMACMNCPIVDVMVAQLACDSSEQFNVMLDMDIADSIVGKFLVVGQNTSYGEFSYEDLPVVFGPLDGDGVTDWKFNIRDSDNGICADSAQLGVISCEVSSASSLNKWANLEIRYADGHPYFIVPEAGLQMQIWSLNGQPVHTSREQMQEGLVIELENYSSIGGMVIVHLVGKTNRYVAKAILVEH